MKNKKGGMSMTDLELFFAISCAAFAMISLLEAWRIDRLQESLNFYKRMDREQMRLIKALREKAEAQENLIGTLNQCLEAERKKHGKGD